MKRYFAKRSEMTAYAATSGLETVRCKQSCDHVPGARPAILLVNSNGVIVERLVRCKVCAQEGGCDGKK